MSEITDEEKKEIEEEAIEEEKAKESSLEIFETMAIPRAVMKLAIPAIVAVLFTMIYNLADTFFIGMTNSDLQVAAVSLCTPLFMVFTAIGTVFGMGGSSVISRAMGAGKMEYVKKVCSFCMWAGLITGVVVLIVYYVLMNPLLTMLGTSEGTREFARNYLQMIAIAGPFAIIPSAFANIIRCEGKSMIAALGMIGGNILNIILDPIFILACGMGTRGAGLATLISMIAATIYYVLYFVISEHSLLSIRIKHFSVREKIVPNVLSIGIPACLGSVMITVSTIIEQRMMAQYGDLPLAAIGIALKVLMIATMLAGGIGQGVQSMLGYCVGARMWERFNKTLRFSLLFAFFFCLILCIVCMIWTTPLVKLFLTEMDSIDYAVQFSRILLWTSPIAGMFYVCQNTMLAMGIPMQSLILNISRQGFVLIPLLFIMRAIMGMNGILWAQPISDIISFVLAIVLLLTAFRKLKRNAELSADAGPNTGQAEAV